MTARPNRDSRRPSLALRRLKVGENDEQGVCQTCSSGKWGILIHIVLGDEVRLPLCKNRCHAYNTLLLAWADWCYGGGVEVTHAPLVSSTTCESDGKSESYRKMQRRALLASAQTRMSLDGQCDHVGRFPGSASMNPLRWSRFLWHLCRSG